MIRWIKEFFGIYKKPEVSTPEPTAVNEFLVTTDEAVVPPLPTSEPAPPSPKVTPKVEKPVVSVAKLPVEGGDTPVNKVVKAKTSKTTKTSRKKKGASSQA